MPTVRAMSADQSVKAAFDSLNRIDRLDQDPYLDHGTSLGVPRTNSETVGNDYSVRVLVNDVTV